MPLQTSEYSPALPWRNGHVSTIYSALFRQVREPALTRERLELGDGDFLDLDWSFSPRPDGKVVVLIHGLEGSARRPYMLGSARTFNRDGYDVCAMNLRGCSGEPNRLYRSYHSGATEDLEAVLRHLLENRDYSAIYLKGFSLGGNLILRYLGEHPEAGQFIRGAAAISVPCDLHDSLLQLEMPKNKIYAQRFLRNLKDKLREKQQLFPDRIPPEMIHGIKSLRDFDDQYTSEAHGFRDALDYYARCSCLPVLPEITVPTLLLNAKNDSFLGPACYPEAICSVHDRLFFESPRHGGHVGFVRSGSSYYNESRAIEFFDAHT